jgi:outer membrane receptor protein involved in Fe transport
MLPPALVHAGESPGPDTIQTVIVTGSRIHSEAGEGTGPVTVVSHEQLTRGGNDSLGKVLQTLPYNTASPTNTNVNNGGDGSTRIDLRGLEPQRTLTLLNGRRLPNGGVGADSSVDIDSLPLSMIERVEVLTTGASAVYGADAIGGVVNVITRSDFRGVELGAQRSESERGDGAITRAQALVGGEIGQGSWMLGADYVDQKGVSMAAREYSAIPIAIASADGTRVATGSPVTPDGVFAVEDGNALGLAPGLYTRVAGARGQTASDWRPATDSDVFNFAPYTYLQTPNERGSLWLIGRQPLGHAIELFVEGVFSHRESSQNLAPAFYVLSTGAAPTLNDGTPYIPASNYYNPFGADLFFPAARRLVELDDRGSSQRVDMWRALAGLRGQLGSWTWEASAAFSDSDALTRENGLPLAARFVTGLGPSGPDASGRIVCGTRDPVTGIVPAGAVIGDCVPINLFGGAGSMTQDQLEYVSGPLRDEGHNTQRLANIGLEGAWGRMPAGEIRWAFGAEFRRESGAYRYDPQRIGGTLSVPPATDVHEGDFEAREGYAEVRLPLIDAQSGWGKLGATLGGRVSDFSTFGTHETWHAGLRWEPSHSWAVRADYATLFRAPALSELYQRQSFGDASEVDPCGDSPTPEQQEHCAANGVPGGSYVQSPDDIFLEFGGGNTDLEPEEGYSFDGGIEFRANGAIAWQASVDFFRTQLDGFIEGPFGFVILNECATHGTAAACSKIQRLPDGSIQTLDTRLSNYGRVTVEGIDVAARLDFDTRAGELSLYALVTRLLTHDEQVFEGSETIDRLGRANFGFSARPQWRGLGGVSWTREAWRASYTLQWIGSLANCTFTQEGDPYCGDVPSVLYHDVDVSYQWDRITIRAGVNNLTDEDPPYLGGGANTDPATYRLLGRTYFLQLSYALK